MFTTELSLKLWVNNLLPASLMEVVDKTLLRREEEDFTMKEQSVLSILSLALKCVMEMPEKKINAIDIVTKLLKLRDILSKAGGSIGDKKQPDYSNGRTSNGLSGKSSGIQMQAFPLSISSLRHSSRTGLYLCQTSSVITRKPVRLFFKYVKRKQ
ncbi:hypothetical protein WN944_024434 [Citrus x changshan-huyou]|uniref:Uncharacterized protein n=1 Tax=Citrus x changshan-huyou TaxID=2935761 RepID=A0AAP0QFQ4_9ROSI